MARVLIVEDERAVDDPLPSLLRRAGFTIIVTRVGPRALDAFARAGADLVLLDLVAPGIDGADVCRAVRARSTVPMIMVSARPDEIDMVVGLELGADDYVTRPYSTRELVARVRAVLRRGRSTRGSGSDARGMLGAGPIRMDVARHVVTVAGGEVPMPLREFGLLEYLLRNAGQVLSRTQLIDRVWGADYRGCDKTLDVHVMRLRAKIEVEPAAPRHLITIRGLGYQLVP